MEGVSGSRKVRSFPSANKGSSTINMKASREGEEGERAEEERRGEERENEQTWGGWGEEKGESRWKVEVGGQRGGGGF